MSFKSDHMSKKNHIDGVRVTVIVKSYSEAFEGVTWDTMSERFSGNQLYGHTKFSDAEIVANLFRYNFGLTSTAKAIGYSQCGSGAYTAAALPQRLSKLNIKNIFMVLVGLRTHGLLEHNHMMPALLEDLTKIGFNRCQSVTICRGRYFQYFCKRLVMDTLDAMIPKEQHLTDKTKVRQAATALGVPLKTIRYWRDKEVTDVMIKR